MIAALALAAAATVATPPESLYRWSDFAGAEAAYARVLASHPRDTLALVRAAALALMRNRHAQARDLIERATRAGASPIRLHVLAAENAYRQDSFAVAARHDRLAGRDSIARMLESFQGRAPYRHAASFRAVVPFVQTDPLPVVEMKINGKGPYFFLIDTGGSEILVDPMVADSVGAPRFGGEMGTFAGGARRKVDLGRLDRVELGGLVIEDVPINVLDTSRFSGAAGGRRVAGVIGTTLLYHFRSTLDYPKGELVLEPLGAPSDSARPGEFHVPFWLGGDHLILARGTVDSSGTLLFFVDTGLAGAAFTCPPSTLANGRIALTDTSAFQGQGGGGGVRVVPFRVRSLSLGGASRQDLLAMLGPFPPSLERSQGYRIAGIISHAFFRAWRVTFDFEAMRLELAPPPK